MPCDSGDLGYGFTIPKIVSDRNSITLEKVISNYQYNDSDDYNMNQNDDNKWRMTSQDPNAWDNYWYKFCCSSDDGCTTNNTKDYLIDSSAIAPFGPKSKYIRPQLHYCDTLTNMTKVQVTWKPNTYGTLLCKYEPTKSLFTLDQIQQLKDQINSNGTGNNYPTNDDFIFDIYKKNCSQLTTKCKLNTLTKEPQSCTKIFQKNQTDDRCSIWYQGQLDKAKISTKDKTDSQVNSIMNYRKKIYEISSSVCNTKNGQNLEECYCVNREKQGVEINNKYQSLAADLQRIYGNNDACWWQFCSSYGSGKGFPDFNQDSCTAVPNTVCIASINQSGTNSIYISDQAKIVLQNNCKDNPPNPDNKNTFIQKIEDIIKNNKWIFISILVFIIFIIVFVVIFIQVIKKQKNKNK